MSGTSDKVKGSVKETAGNAMTKGDIKGATQDAKERVKQDFKK